jgi:hypothetical protein
LTAQHADFNLHHVQPAGVLWDIVELQSAKDPSCFARREGLVQRAGRVGGQIVEDHTNSICLGKVHIAEFAHANGEVLRGPPVGDLYLAPGSVGIEENEQIDRPVASILAVIALRLPRHGLDRLPYLTDELGRALVETDNRALRIRHLRI